MPFMQRFRRVTASFNQCVCFVTLYQVDLLPLNGRQKLLARACKRLAATFAHTMFAGCPMVAVAAKPGAAGSLAGSILRQPNLIWVLAAATLYLYPIHCVTDQCAFDGCNGCYRWG
jgi:hypothetical protein